MAEISKELLASAEKYSKEYNIPVSVILAFAGNETSFGTAGMGKSKNNLFGIGSKTYSDIDSSVKDFAALVTGNKDSSQSKVYGEATKDAKTVKDWVSAITKAGYNSQNKNYVSDTMSVYDYYNLGQYDKQSVAVGSTDKAAKNKVGLVWWGDIVKVVFILILIVLGVVMLGSAVTSNTPAKEIIKKMKGGGAK